MSGVVSFFASGPQGQQGRAGLLTLRRGSRCERAQHGPRSAHPSPTPGATVRRTSLAALAPRAGVPPPGGHTPRRGHWDRPIPDRLSGPVCPLAAVLARPWPTSPGPLPRSSGRSSAASPRRTLWFVVRTGASRGAQTEVPPLRGGNLSRGSDQQCEEGWRHDGSTPQPAGTTPAYAVPALAREGIGTVRWA